MIPIEEISNFPNHHFKVIDDDKMIEIVASIKKIWSDFSSNSKKKKQMVAMKW